MIPRVLAIVATCLLLCGCRTREAIPDDGLAGLTFQAPKFSCDELLVDERGELWGEFTVENPNDAIISMQSGDLKEALINLKSRIGTPAGFAFIVPDPDKIPHYTSRFFDVPARSTKKIGNPTFLRMTEAWTSLPGPTPVEILGTVEVYYKQEKKKFPLVVNATLRRR